MEATLKFGETLRTLEKSLEKPVKNWKDLAQHQKEKFTSQKGPLTDRTGKRYFEFWKKHVEEISTELQSFYRRRPKKKFLLKHFLSAQFRGLKNKQEKLIFVFAIECCGLDLPQPE